jgi:glycosyltransferase involved in cell wall biosynthesis
MGCDVVVYTRGPYMNRKGSFRYEGVRLIPLPCLRHPALETFSHSLLAVIAVLVTRPDIVHVHAVGPSLFVPMLRLAGLRVVMTHHGPDYKREKWGWQARRVLKAGETCGARYANALIAVSPYIASYVQRSFKRPASFIPNGMCLQESPIGAEALDRLGLVKQRYILGIGRLVPEKCFHDLIDAFVLFQKTHPDCSRGWKLVIVGRIQPAISFQGFRVPRRGHGRLHDRRGTASGIRQCRDVRPAVFI